MFEFHWATLVLMGLGCFVLGAFSTVSGPSGGSDD